MNSSVKSSYPISFARFYDIIYKDLRDCADKAFFLNEIKSANGKVLEIGTGTGRMFYDSLKTGVDIYGIDNSAEMLEILFQKISPEQKNRVSVQNIIDFNFDFKFSKILAPFRVFMHLYTIPDQLNALNNICKHLNPGGVFIFDVFYPDLKQLISGIENDIDFEGEYKPNKKLKRTVTTKPDIMEQIIDVEFTLEWEEDDSLNKDTFHIPLRYFFKHELNHLIQRSDFDHYNIYGGYSKETPDNNSKDLLIYCYKR